MADGWNRVMAVSTIYGQTATKYPVMCADEKLFLPQIEKNMEKKYSSKISTQVRRNYFVVIEFSTR